MARTRGRSADHPFSRRIWRSIQIVVAIAVLAGVFLYLVPKVASYSSVARVIGRLTAGQVGILLAATAFNIFSYWPQMVAAMPGLTLAQAAVNNQASTAIANTVPGGGALGVAVAYRMFRTWGFDNAAIGLMALATGVWNDLIKFTLPPVALGILAIEGDVTRNLAVAGAVGLAALIVAVTLLALALWKESFAEALGSWAERGVNVVRRRLHRKPMRRWDSAMADFRRRILELARTRWHWLSLTTVVSHLALFLVLLIALRDVGVTSGQVTWAEALGVFAFARLASAIPITPGGAGVIELTYIGGLVLAGGSHAEVVAAVLVFRALTWGLQIPLGPVAYLVYRSRTSWTKPRPRPAPKNDAAGRREPARSVR